MTTKTPTPDWAIEEACRRLNEGLPDKTFYPIDYNNGRSVTLLADMIAKYEPPPADPLLVEARRMASEYDGTPGFYEDGSCDGAPRVQLYYAALKRGWAMAMKEMGK